ncbi:MAG: hypothetical protein HEQ37_15815 [Acidovorax sp.]|nr:hypothetical protein [Acidovorax sp.]
MTLLRDLRRCGAQVLAPLVAAAALLSACGGGTEQVKSFVPARLLVLGDETSMIVNDGTADGFKYSINDRRGTTTGKCLLQPTFTQQIASHYGMVFAECNHTAATPKAFIHARLGAQAGSDANGLQAQLAGITDLGSRDMVTVMIGTNDMISAYEQVRDGILSEAQALTQVEAAGRTAANAINGIIATGARAMVFTVPDLSLSPYAKAQELLRPGAKDLLKRLAAGPKGIGGYNGQLLINVQPNDGRLWGLVLADNDIAEMVRFPGSFLGSPANVTDAACPTVTANQCVLTDTDATTTLVAAAQRATNTYLWASDRHMGPAAHARIGSQAVSRAINNPF